MAIGGQAVRLNGARKNAGERGVLELRWREESPVIVYSDESSGYFDSGERGPLVCQGCGKSHGRKFMGARVAHWSAWCSEECRRAEAVRTALADEGSS